MHRTKSTPTTVLGKTLILADLSAARAGTPGQLAASPPKRSGVGRHHVGSPDAPNRHATDASVSASIDRDFMTGPYAVRSGRRATPGSRLLRASAVLIALLVVAGCSKSDGETSSSAVDSKSPTPSVESGAPKVGACIEPVTAFMAGGHLMPVLVSCDEPHGGEVIAVYDVPAETVDYPALGQDLLGVDKASDACAGSDGDIGAFGEFAGDNRLQSKDQADKKAPGETWLVSSLEGLLFLPSPSKWEAGERWVACVAILRNSEEALSQYSGTARGAVKPGELSSEFAWCKRQLDPNDSRGFVIVSCDQPHTHEQIASFAVGAPDDPFPGEQELDSLASSVCPGLVSTGTGKRFKGKSDDFTISWTYPVEGTWYNGDRTARCYIMSLGGESTGTVGSGTAKKGDRS